MVQGTRGLGVWEPGATAPAPRRAGVKAKFRPQKLSCRAAFLCGTKARPEHGSHVSPSLIHSSHPSPTQTPYAAPEPRRRGKQGPCGAVRNPATGAHIPRRRRRWAVRGCSPPYGVGPSGKAGRDWVSGRDQSQPSAGLLNTPSVGERAGALVEWRGRRRPPPTAACCRSRLRGSIRRGGAGATATAGLPSYT